MTLRVVLVDDDAFMADLVAAQLRSFGVRDVVTVTDGHAALAAVIDDPRVFQVMLCDLRMPGMDGIELMRHLAQRKACRSVVLLSGEDDRILASAKQLAPGCERRLRRSPRLLLRQAHAGSRAAELGGCVCNG